MVQYKLPNTNVGNYFAPPGTQGSSLGVYTSGRQSVSFFAERPAPALKSRAAPMVDSHSMPDAGRKIQTEGGGTQYFVPDTSTMKATR